jgi:stage IV sporulation protein FB
MKLSFKIFEYKKIPIYFDLLFLALFIFLPVNLTIYILLSILIHEMGHIYMATKLGYGVEKGFVTFFGGGTIIDKSYLKNNNHVVKIAFAGPFANLILLLILIIIGAVGEISFNLSLNNNWLLENIQAFGAINLILAAMNLIPVHPLDGDKMLLYSLKNAISDKRSEIISISISVIICFSFLILSIKLGDIILSVFAVLFILINLIRIKSDNAKTDNNEN